MSVRVRAARVTAVSVIAVLLATARLMILEKKFSGVARTLVMIAVCVTTAAGAMAAGAMASAVIEALVMWIGVVVAVMMVGVEAVRRN